MFHSMLYLDKVFFVVASNLLVLFWLLVGFKAQAQFFLFNSGNFKTLSKKTAKLG